MTDGHGVLLVGLWIIVLLACIGSQHLPSAIGSDDARAVLLCALLLNIALSLLGAIRHRRLLADSRLCRTLEARVQTLASRDPLTGLANRRTLAEVASGTMITAARRGLSIAVLTVNLDNFRSVNEGPGHEAGDAVLVDMAEALTALIPPSATVARLGGDEFCCLMTFDAGRPATVDGLVAAIMARLTRPLAVGRESIRRTVSIGIARTEPGDMTIDAAMRRADIALSAVKKAGGDAASWFDAGMGRELAVRNAIEAGLRTAIPAGRIVPYYEQQIDLSTGRLAGFEVLARWDHPTDGILLPDRFIPIAEEAGLVSDLSMSIMRQAFEHAASWDPGLTLSVNISPGQLKDPWLAEKILKLLIETNFPPQRLEIEITETSLFDNLALAQSIVASLKNQGVRLALDDFGTGYSSLAHLRALPFDRIKIDKSFVMAMADDPECTAIVEAITRLGHSLSVPVTAEGVETAAIAGRLRALGCHKVQGWHYGRPLDVQQVRRLLADRSLLGTARAA
ncbi:putative bifunctional diguanylate cyclase/phosphodiesterase [Sphingomonas montana]|uniref:putative bifunctional diguanylate cyclase/phosphodiesterase n=1 Tax=Sphingomonas montana TaxID=1843236 RepID=UPI001F0B001C|nr:EAL domain-containing protein [Sphingomonas montana]